MRKLYYYILICLVATFGFTITANAATSDISTSVPVSNGSNFTIYTQSYTDILGHNITTEGNETGDSYVEFDPTYNVILTGVDQKYLNGYIILTINISPSIPSAVNWTYYGLNYTRPYNDDGVKVFVGLNTYNYFRIIVLFDNYSNDSNQIDLGSFTPKYIAKIGDVTPLKGNFTTSFSIYSNHLQKDQYIQNDRTTELLYSAIYQATGEQLTNIITALNTIKNQDPVYYNQIITGLTAINSTLGQTNSNLLNILNEIDLDFAAVQTILDLFPSYRTQVLQYWQELLQMNAAQSSQAAEMESEYADRDNQSDQLLGGLDSIQFPTISSGDLNVLKNVDTEGKANFFGLISLITNNSLVTNILLIVVTGMIAGYALYGKKN